MNVISIDINVVFVRCCDMCFYQACVFEKVDILHALYRIHPGWRPHSDQLTILVYKAVGALTRRGAVITV